MAWRIVENFSMLVAVNEPLTLPRTSVGIDIKPDGTNNGWEIVPIARWKDNRGQVVTRANTSTKGEFMYYGEVSGYPQPVYLSLVVGHNVENPESKFPVDFMHMSRNDIPDEYGTPKREVRTADMPNIDDYQALKSKKNKNTFETAQEQKLAELLSAKIIKAEDINALRNALINTQKYCLSLIVPFNMTFTDMENIGNGEGRIYAGDFDNTDSFGKIAEFRSIKSGDNIEIRQDGDQIVISADVPPPEGGDITNDFCSLDTLKAVSYQTCDLMYNQNDHPLVGGAFYKFSDYLGMKAVGVAYKKDVMSIMHVFGQGDGIAKSMVNAGRMVKGVRDFIIEMKTGSGYSGIQICGNHNKDGNTGKVVLYENDPNSHVASALITEEVTLDDRGFTTVRDASSGNVFAYSAKAGCGVK